eukprot:2679353-Rhodomonas_salina.1
MFLEGVDAFNTHSIGSYYSPGTPLRYLLSYLLCATWFYAPLSPMRWPGSPLCYLLFACRRMPWPKRSRKQELAVQIYPIPALNPGARHYQTGK